MKKAIAGGFRYSWSCDFGIRFRPDGGTIIIVSNATE